MSIQEAIDQYFLSLTPQKQSELKLLHLEILTWLPNCQLWYESGLDVNNKVVSNPNIGYGEYTIHYANGGSRKFYQIGLSANSMGISVYIMGIKDKFDLQSFLKNRIGKAKVTGYCIKFKSLNDINMNILKEAIIEGQKCSSNEPSSPR